MSRIKDFETAMDLLTIVANDHGVEIDGENYVMVKDRVEVFRQCFGGDYGISTSITVTPGSDLVMAKCEISDNTGFVVSTGHSVSWPGKGGVDGHIEMAETQAVGRALAFFGLGGSHVASAEEMRVVGEPVMMVPKKNNVTPFRPKALSLQQALDTIKAAGDSAEVTRLWASFKPLMETLKNEDEIATLQAALANRLQELEKGNPDGKPQ